MLDYLKQLAFGLDIGSSMVSCLKVRRRGRRLALSGFNMAPLAAGIIRAGQIQDEIYLAEIIKKTVAASRPRPINDFFVNLALPEQTSFLQIIQLPKMDLAEVKEAVKWEIEANIPLPLESVYYDWRILKTPLKKEIDHFDILVAAAPKNIVESYMRVVKRAGFFPKSLEIDSFSLSRALVPSGVAANPILIVELTPHQATLIIFSGETPRFSSSIPLSGRYFAEMVTVEEDSVRHLKIQKIKEVISQSEKESTKLPFNNKEVNSEIKTQQKPLPIFANFLIEQIRSYMEFYEDHAEHEHREESVKVQKIFLCGSVFSGLKTLLEKNLGVVTEIGNPFINISKNPQKYFSAMSFEQALVYSKSLGLAIKDFLPDDYS